MHAIGDPRVPMEMGQDLAHQVHVDSMQLELMNPGWSVVVM